MVECRGGGSALEVFGPVDVDGGVVVVEVQRDREGDGRLGGCQQDDEQCDHLPVQAQRRGTFAAKVRRREGHEIDVGTVEHAMQTTPAVNRIAPTTR